MTNEEKERVRKNIIYRVGYGLKIEVRDKQGCVSITTLTTDNAINLYNGEWVEFKPFLKSLKDISKEELMELKEYSKYNIKSYDRARYYAWCRIHHYDHTNLLADNLAYPIVQ